MGAMQERPRTLVTNKVQGSLAKVRANLFTNLPRFVLLRLNRPLVDNRLDELVKVGNLQGCSCATPGPPSYLGAPPLPVVAPLLPVVDPAAGVQCSPTNWFMRVRSSGAKVRWVERRVQFLKHVPRRW